MVTITIHLSELKKIVSGEKKEDYRYISQFYLDKFGFCEDNKFKKFPELNSIKFVCANQKMNFYCIVEISDIRYEKFMQFIPEKFQQGDEAFTIYIKKVIEHNLIY